MALDVEKEMDERRKGIGAKHYTQPPKEWLDMTVGNTAKEEKMKLDEQGRTKAAEVLRELILQGEDAWEPADNKWSRCFVSAAMVEMS
jgi:hypothetical protein